MIQSQPTPPLPQRRSRLCDTFATLASTPDDHSSVDRHLVTIAQLSAQRIAAVSYASVTARREGAYATVAASSDIALTVDQAQYADQAGPCLDALDTAKPLGVPEIAVTMRWPSFRETANRLGLHTSLSIPVFAGRGESVAALNLYGRDPVTMTVLTTAVWATYDEAAPTSPDLEDQDPGGAELVDGLTEAFAVRAVIQQAIGTIIVQHSSTADRAYAILRLSAADGGTSMLGAARAVLLEQL